MENIFNNTVIRNETGDLGRKIVDFYKSKGIKTENFTGNDSRPDKYYGVISNEFNLYDPCQVNGNVRIIKLPFAGAKVLEKFNKDDIVVANNDVHSLKTLNKLLSAGDICCVSRLSTQYTLCFEQRGHSLAQDHFTIDPTDFRIATIEEATAYFQGARNISQVDYKSSEIVFGKFRINAIVVATRTTSSMSTGDIVQVSNRSTIDKLVFGHYISYEESSWRLATDDEIIAFTKGIKNICLINKPLVFGKFNIHDVIVSTTEIGHRKNGDICQVLTNSTKDRLHYKIDNHLTDGGDPVTWRIATDIEKHAFRHDNVTNINRIKGRPLENLVFGKFSKNAIVVSMTDVTGIRKKGDIIKIIPEHSSLVSLCYGNNHISVTLSDWRIATKEEVEGFIDFGFKNIEEVRKHFDARTPEKLIKAFGFYQKGDIVVATDDINTNRKKGEMFEVLDITDKTTLNIYNQSRGKKTSTKVSSWRMAKASEAEAYRNGGIANVNLIKQTSKPLADVFDSKHPGNLVLGKFQLRDVIVMINSKHKPHGYMYNVLLTSTSHKLIFGTRSGESGISEDPDLWRVATQAERHYYENGGKYTRDLIEPFPDNSGSMHGTTYGPFDHDAPPIRVQEYVINYGTAGVKPTPEIIGVTTKKITPIAIETIQEPLQFTPQKIKPLSII